MGIRQNIHRAFKARFEFTTIHAATRRHIQHTAGIRQHPVSFQAHNLVHRISVDGVNFRGVLVIEQQLPFHAISLDSTHGHVLGGRNRKHGILSQNQIAGRQTIALMSSCLIPRCARCIQNNLTETGCNPGVYRDRIPCQFQGGSYRQNTIGIIAGALEINDAVRIQRGIGV